MTFKPIKWENHVVDTDGTILQAGTPLSAENMNRIEEKLTSLDEDQHVHENQEVLDSIKPENVHEHANKEVVDALTQEHLDDSHKHSNKQVLDSIKEENVHKHANKSVLDNLTQQHLDDSHAHDNEDVLNQLTQKHLDDIRAHTQTLSDHEQRLINIVTSLTNLKIRVVANITERNALSNKDAIVHVVDASADTTVNSGWAQYIYQNNAWVKIAESESIDVVLAWANIIGKPTTFPPASHGHAWSEITGKPTSFTPATHAHAWDDITGKPTTFSPSNHQHKWSEITEKPTALPANGGNADTVDNLHAKDFGRAYSGSYGFGGSQTALTTAEFITLLTDLGAFNQPYWVARGSWSYAGNKFISDTGIGNIHLAGCTVEVIGIASAYTIRIHTPTTSPAGITSTEYVYVNNGATYSPGWRKIWNDKNDGAGSGLDADLLDGKHATDFALATHSHTKNDIGLGNVLNYAVATQAIAEAGTSNEAYMTPLRAMQLITKWAQNNLASATKDGLMSATSYTELTQAVQNLATAMQHLDKKDNPHTVTKAQVGLGSVLNYGIATQANAEAGTSNAVYMTPLRVKNAIDKFVPKALSGFTNDKNFVSSNAAQITVSATAPTNPSVNDIWIKT